MTYPREPGTGLCSEGFVIPIRPMRVLGLQILANRGKAPVRRVLESRLVSRDGSDCKSSRTGGRPLFGGIWNPDSTRAMARITNPREPGTGLCSEGFGIPTRLTRWPGLQILANRVRANSTMDISGPRRYHHHEHQASPKRRLPWHGLNEGKTHFLIDKRPSKWY